MNLLVFRNFIFSYPNLFFQCIIVFIPCIEIPLIICLCFSLLCRRGHNHFDVHFRRIVPYPFLSKEMREEMDGSVFITRQSRHLFPLINNMIKVLFLICTLIWRANIYFSRQGKVYLGEIKVQLLLYKL